MGIMTITLTLTPEEETLLRGKAALSGQPAEDYALDLLRRDFAFLPPNGAGHAALPQSDTSLRASLATWLAEVESVDAVPHPVPDKNKEYVDLLVEKYRKQGLEL